MNGPSLDDLAKMPARDGDTILREMAGAQEREIKKTVRRVKRQMKKRTHAQSYREGWLAAMKKADEAIADLMLEAAHQIIGRDTDDTHEMSTLICLRMDLDRATDERFPNNKVVDFEDADDD